MKKNILNICCIIIAAIGMSTMLTSCEDEYVSSTLEGTWEGKMYVEYNHDGHNYDIYSTEITFFKDPYHYTSGDGRWIDHLNSNPWNRKYFIYDFVWRVEDGKIYMRFRSDGAEFRIRNYRINDSYFRGEIESTDGNWREFRLRHIASPNWDDYDDYYGYDYGYTYYYAPSRSDSTSIEVMQPQLPVRRIK